MKIIEIVTKRKPLILVVPEGVEGNGWEALRKAISLVQDFSDQAGRVSKEMIEDFQVSKGIYRGCRSYADVVAEEGPRNEALLPVGKWVRAVICESKEKVQDWVHVGKAIVRMMGMKGMGSVTPISAYKGSVEIHSEEVGEGNEGGTGLSEACRLVEGEVVGGDASKCRATCVTRGGRWGLCAKSSTKVVPLFVHSQGSVKARASGDEAFSDEDGRAFERKAQSLPNPSPLSAAIVDCNLKGPSWLGQRIGGMKPSIKTGLLRREEDAAMRKVKAFEVQTRGSVKKEEKFGSKKLWTTLFPPSFDRRQGLQSRIEPLLLRKSSLDSEECLKEEDFGAGS
ncbi:hypothetical protein CK203_022582 [Vitis vinifera]|uniref:DUF4283 domain-containing protein n=1 Tax=Vitis vinifera TaxID=29760 RepID=A0A438JEF3_VITVI|nr:hypothetical protein CK203_022582 [Vitis vinifera]